MIVTSNRVVLVSYDLKTPGKNYAPLYESLKKQGVWWHYLESTWLVAGSKSPKDIYAAVVSDITTSDRLLIIEVKRPYWGYMPQEVWDWLEKHLPPDMYSGAMGTLSGR